MSDRFEFTLFVIMKAVAFFLMICMTLVSVLPGKGQSLQSPQKMDCCKKMTKDTPCNHQKKHDCKHGMCLTRYCCNVHGFVPVEPFCLNALVIGSLDQIIPYLQGRLSDYVSESFRPPKV
jgi:hypothetical protein